MLLVLMLSMAATTCALGMNLYRWTMSVPPRDKP